MLYVQMILQEGSVACMALGLEIMAVVILSMYWNFARIIKGNAIALELLILQSLAEWIIKSGKFRKFKLWTLLLFSVLLEAVYFYLAFRVIRNPALELLTGFLAGIEFYHITTLFLRLKLFFRGKTTISQIFNWRVERISAIFFFTHSLLVLISLFILKVY